MAAMHLVPEPVHSGVEHLSSRSKTLIVTDFTGAYLSRDGASTWKQFYS